MQIDHECDFPVCQLRLDFLDFEIAPPTSGNCNRDQFIIRADEPLPVLCGKSEVRLFIYSDKKFQSSSGHPNSMNKQYLMVRGISSKLGIRPKVKQFTNNSRLLLIVENINNALFIFVRGGASFGGKHY